MTDKRKLYLDLAEGFKKAYPDKKPIEIQSETNAYWASIKNNEGLLDIVKTKLIELQKLQTKAKVKLMTYWAKVCTALYGCIIIQ